MKQIVRVAVVAVGVLSFLMVGMAQVGSGRAYRIDVLGQRVPVGTTHPWLENDRGSTSSFDQGEESSRHEKATRQGVRRNILGQHVPTGTIQARMEAASYSSYDEKESSTSRPRSSKMAFRRNVLGQKVSVGTNRI